MASEDTLVRRGAGDRLPDALARVRLLEQGDRLKHTDSSDAMRRCRW